jgi:cell division protein FtsB
MERQSLPEDLKGSFPLSESHSKTFFHLAGKGGLLAGMNPGESIWDKLTRLVLSLVVAAALLGIALWYRPVIQENQRMREQKLELDRKIAVEMETARKLDASLHALQDPKTVERLARERLSYAKPGEDVIHFDPPAQTNAPAVP